MRKLFNIFAQILSDRTILILSLLFLCAVGGLVWHQSRLQTRLVESTALRHAAGYTEALSEFRTLYTSEVVQAASAHGISITHDYQDKKSAIPLPATLSMILGNRLAETNGGGQSRLYSPYPFPWRRDQGGLRGDFDQAAWAFLQKHPNEPYYRFEDVNGVPSLRYATADLMRPSCIDCHNHHPQTPKRDWQEGDLRGILEVVLPLDVAVAQTNADLQESTLAIGGVALLGLISVTTVVRRLRFYSAELEQQVAERTSELNQSNQQLSLQQGALDEFIIVAETDTQGRITFANGKFSEYSQFTREELVGQDHRIINSGLHPKSFFQNLWQTIGSGGTWRGEIRNRAKDGSFYWVDSTIMPMLGPNSCPEKYLAFSLDITVRKRAEAEFESLNKQLIENSRQAGMAEMATGVLHNVGNVLNSVNVAASLAVEKVKQSRVDDLTKATALMDEHANHLGDYVTSDQRGRHLPEFLKQLAKQLLGERDTVLKKLTALIGDIEHIKEIVSVQQSYAKAIGATGPVDLSEVVEDALKINEAGLNRHAVELALDYQPVPLISTDRNKVLQILINLISNAKYALDHSGNHHRRLAIRIAARGASVKVEIQDNGVGIARENLTQIFQHGFTTKKEGHGFGLHASALAAKELGGALAVHSDGPGQGAVFSLELPIEFGGKIP